MCVHTTWIYACEEQHTFVTFVSCPLIPHPLQQPPSPSPSPTIPSPASPVFLRIPDSLRLHPLSTFPPPPLFSPPSPTFSSTRFPPTRSVDTFCLDSQACLLPAPRVLTGTRPPKRRKRFLGFLRKKSRSLFRILTPKHHLHHESLPDNHPSSDTIAGGSSNSSPYQGSVASVEDKSSLDQPYQDPLVRVSSPAYDESPTPAPPSRPSTAHRRPAPSAPQRDLPPRGPPPPCEACPALERRRVRADTDELCPYNCPYWAWACHVCQHVLPYKLFQGKKRHKGHFARPSAACRGWRCRRCGHGRCGRCRVMERCGCECGRCGMRVAPPSRECTVCVFGACGFGTGERCEVVAGWVRGLDGST